MENYQVEDKSIGEGLFIYPTTSISLMYSLEMTGSYGEVFKAKERGTGRVVALKRMKFNLVNEGLPGAAMREISNMIELKHKNIVRCVCSTRLTKPL
jgi:serine/threonine protein kinase